MAEIKRITVAGILGLLLLLGFVGFAHSAVGTLSEPISPTLSPSSLVPQIPGTFLTGPNEGQPLAIALNFIGQHQTDLRMSEAEVAALVLKDSYLSKASGTSHLYFGQTYNGIEVHNGLLNINIGRDGSIINVGNRTIPHLNTVVQQDRQQVSAVSALQLAAKHLGLDLNHNPAVQEVIGGAEQKVVFGSSSLSRHPIPARLVYQPVADGSIRLAWAITILELTGENWWDVRVDAVTGQVLDQNNFMIHDDWGISMADKAGELGEVQLGLTAVPSSYLVYAMPVESPNFAVPAPPADARTAEISPWLDAPSASPLGWHATSTISWTNTQGNNVDTHKDATRYDCGLSLECDPALDLTMEPTTPGNLDAALVNLFYWNNIIHDLTYEYGFDEVAGNFQDDNFGIGGLGGDRVNANAHSPGSCGGGFATPPDGSQPVMNMYTCGLASPARDGALDNFVIAHEYGHGVAARLTGGPQSVGCLNNAEAMVEGWGDWLGLMMTIEPGDSGTDLRPVGTWLFGQGPTGSGIRIFPYTTDFNLNPHTYGDIVTANGPHDVGEVWATMVWDMVWAMIDQHGYNPDFYADWSTGGNNLAFQLVIDGLKLQPCGPGFVDGRDAILLADQSLTGGQNQCLIWQAFADRGLGFSASQGSPNSTTDGVEAFDLPGFCEGQAVGVLERDKDVIEGSAVVGSSFTDSLTITNTGTAPFDYSINSGAAWAVVDPSEGTLSQTESVDLAVVFDSSLTAGIGTYTASLTFSGTYGNNPAPVMLVFEVLPEEAVYEIFLPVVLSGSSGSAVSVFWLLLPLSGMTAVFYRKKGVALYRLLMRR